MAKSQQISKGGRCRRRGAHHALIGKYTRQRIRTEANRIRKLKKHLKQHPNDLQALKLIK